MLLLHHNPDGSCTHWSASHRRIRAEGITNDWERQRIGWRAAPQFAIRNSQFVIRKSCSHVDLHHELPPSQGGVQISSYTLRAMASVAGLASARACLKGRMRELLCIHGRRMVPEAGIAPTSPPLQGGANLSQLLGDGWIGTGPESGSRKMVVPRGNAPRSPAYRAGALLLSYGTTVSRGFSPKRLVGRNTRVARVTRGMRSGRRGL